jgi:hypothetical protein
MTRPLHERHSHRKPCQMTQFSKLGALLVLGSIAMTGCGSSDNSSDGGSTKSATPSASALPSPPGGGISSAQLKAIRTCLKAAGLSNALPTGAPNGGPPSDAPTGAPPTGAPPSGAPDGAPDGAAQMRDPKVQAALKACGIDFQR